MPRPTAITRPTALIALCLLIGCEGETPALVDASVDGEVPGDGAPDAGDAMCIGAEAEPLMACTPPTVPDSTCGLTVEIGGRLRTAATFDGAGRLTSSSDGEFGDVWGFDATGQNTRWERVHEGCLMSRRLSWQDGDRVVRRNDEPGKTPSCTAESFVGEVAIERVDDAGCDCVDTHLDERCDVEDGRPVRCVSWAADGTPRGVETRAWTADGLLARAADDFDGDGVEDHVEVFEYDAAGRMTVKVETRADCEGEDGGEGACAQRWTWTYEDDLRRTTRRIDEGDDGSVERIDRTTIDEIGRRVLDETSPDGGETWIVTTWTREVEGDRTTITRAVDGVVREVRVEETDAAGRLLSLTTELPEQGVMATLELDYDAAGRIVQERRTVEGACPQGYACTADYRWDGENCPDLRAWTDADVVPLEQVFPVGSWCVPQSEGC